MSTNYYVNEPVCDCPCPHCTAPEHPHIGKYNGAVEFSFSAVHGPKSWKEWKEYLKGKEIVAEHGMIHTREEFIEIVESSRKPGNENQTLWVRRNPSKVLPSSQERYYLDEEGWSFNRGEFS